MLVLIDTSVWVDYFRNGNRSGRLDFLIDENLIAANEIILAELIPFLKVRKQHAIIRMLHSVARLKLSIDWDQIVDLQTACLKNGINGIGIPDLIIAQNATQHRCPIYSLDSHFPLMKDILGLQLFE